MSDGGEDNSTLPDDEGDAVEYAGIAELDELRLEHYEPSMLPPVDRPALGALALVKGKRARRACKK